MDAATTEPMPTVDAGDFPTLFVNQLIFSDGTVVALGPNDIVVFVGPNNAGKSATLREIEAHLANDPAPHVVVKSINIIKSGSAADVRKAIVENSHETYQGTMVQYVGNGYQIPAMQIAPGWEKHIEWLFRFFCRRLKTESRITDSNPAPSFRVLSEAASRPMQMMYADSNVEDRLSSYFKAAFGQDLILLKAGGSEIPLLVGKREPLQPNEDPTKRSYLDRLMQNVKPLHQQGDGMRSFASVILEMLVDRVPSMLLLDEPEAFLHPPQARLLGEYIAKERRLNTQLFIATHSPDVLMGLLNAASKDLKVIRIQRNENINSVKELENEKAKSISADPLTKYSPVLSGVFHQRTIICESDADCLFYQALLSQRTVYDGPHPDVLFLHASGKHRIAKMAGALRSLGVPLDVIADIDLISEQNTFRVLVETMGGVWADIEADWMAVKTVIENRKPWLNAEAVSNEITKILDNIDGQAELPKKAASEIVDALKRSSPWGAVKTAGEAAIPNGQPTAQFRKICSYLASIGIWIVPVGELEGFCRDIGSHGPKWVQAVLESKNLADDPNLEDARKFVRSIWNSKPNTALQ